MNSPQNGRIFPLQYYLFSDAFKHFRLGSSGTETINLVHNEEKYDLNIEFADEKLLRSKLPSGKICDATIIDFDAELLRVLIDKEVCAIRYFLNDKTVSIWSENYGRFVFKVSNSEKLNNFLEIEPKDQSGRIISLMPCKINQILVKVGDIVEIGSPLCVTEAMKMEVITVLKIFNYSQYL